MDVRFSQLDVYWQDSIVQAENSVGNGSGVVGRGTKQVLRSVVITCLINDKLKIAPHLSLILPENMNILSVIVLSLSFPIRWITGSNRF